MSGSIRRTKKFDRLMIRITEDNLNLIKKAAEIAGISCTQMVTESSVKTARNILDGRD